jgi:dephospho-CoA kinase
MKPKRFVVGLTGGIGTGKSTVLAEFDRLGAATVSLDQIAREQAKPGREGYKAVLRAFGKSVLNEDGRLDRSRLGDFVFKHPAARKKLEKATHPIILKEMDRLISSLKGVVIVDVPLLFEVGLQKRFDATILVSSRPAQQVSRTAKRDGLTPAQVRARMRAQWPLARKKKLADLTIDNLSTPAALKARVKDAHAGLQLLYGGTPNGNQDD